MSVNAFNYDVLAWKIVVNAKEQALKAGLPMIVPENLLLAILADKTSNSTVALSKFVDIDELSAKIQRSLPKNANSNFGDANKLPLSPETKQILNDSFIEMKGYNTRSISVEHILLGILRSPHHSAGMYLSFYGINYSTIKMILDKMNYSNSSATNSKTASQQNSSCGSGCGCQTTTPVAHAAPKTASQSSDSVPPSVQARFASLTKAVSNGLNIASAIAQNITDKSKARNEWDAVLDEAIKMSEATGIPVPAAFVQLSFANQSNVDAIYAKQIRQEAFSDAIETLIQKT